MKKLMIIIIFILLVQIASATYGGESEVIYSFPECLNLTIKVNASLQINDGEFSFLNCTKINQSYWISNCSDNFDLILTTEQNTINNYSFYILYYASYEESAVVLNRRSGGGGNTRCNTKWECTVWTTCSQAETQTRVCTDKNNCGTTTGKPVEIQKCNYVPLKTTTTQEEETEPETTSGEVEPVLAEEPPVTEEVADNATEGLGGVTGRFFQNITGSNKWIGIIILILLFGGLFYFFVLKKK